MKKAYEKHNEMLTQAKMGADMSSGVRAFSMVDRGFFFRLFGFRHDLPLVEHLPQLRFFAQQGQGQEQAAQAVLMRNRL